MWLALGDALAVEVRHLLDQVLVLEQDRPVGSDGEGELVAGNRGAGVRGRAGFVGHAPLSFSWCVGDVWQSGQKPQNVTSASSTRKPRASAGVTHGGSPMTQSTSLIAPHERQTRWWWLSSTRVS